MYHAILQNAVDSIQLGVEDLESSDNRRILSAVRNITAGVLLLFKEKLRQLSPPDSKEVLLMQQIRIQRSDKSLMYIGTGSKTVDVQQIRERFSDLQVSTNWRLVDAIVRARNDVEHRATSISPAILKQLIHDSFLVISDFITSELHAEPAQMLGTSTWKKLLDASQVYDAQLIECRAQLERISWPTDTHERVADELRCEQCSSELLKPLNPEEEDPANMEFLCRACGQSSEYSELVEEAVGQTFQADFYIAMTDGGDPPIEDCYECGRATFIVELGECIACQASIKHKSCAACHTSLSVSEQSLRGLCSRCRYLLDKDD